MVSLAMVVLDVASWGVREVQMSVVDDQGRKVWAAFRSLEPFVFPAIRLPAGNYSLRAAASDFAENSTEHEIELGLEAPSPTAACSVGFRHNGSSGPIAAALLLAAWKARRLTRTVRLKACVKPKKRSGTPRRNAMRTILMLAAALGCCSCGDSSNDCTEAGCIDGVQVSFATPIDTTQLSATFQFDGREILCESETVGKSCGEGRVLLDFANSTLHGFTLLDEHPESLTFAFYQSGNLLVSGTVSPSYEVQRPNGPDCPPVCNSAYVEF